MLERYQLSYLPPYARLFVALVTSLMVLICLWAMFILYVEKGMIISDASNDTERQTHHDVEQQALQAEPEEFGQRLRRNVGLAHVHINGQTLLFAVMGMMFLLTSVSSKNKSRILALFAIVIVLHAVGLSGEHLHWFFDDILALSGVAILVLMLYMALRVFVDLAKPRAMIAKE